MISTARLDELRSEVGEDDFGEIVALFIAESDGIVDLLASVSDPAQGEELLHALKGSALNLGFDTLAALCREGGDARAGTPAWAARVDLLVDVYRQSKSSLATFT